MKRAKNLKTITAGGLMTASMALTSIMGAAVPAMAATTYTPVAGTSCNFNKYLIMDAGDNVPNATFSFTVVAGTARSVDTADNSVMQVNAGNDGVTSSGLPTIADVTFADGDATATAAGTNIDVARDEEDRTGTAGTDTVQLDSGEKYATQQATVDFSQVTYNEPGIYRYVVRETADADHAAAGIIHDTDTDRILDVYVTDNGSGTLVVSSYVLHTDDDDVVINNTMGSADVAQAAAALDDKTDGFTNEFTSKDLVFKKEVTGNQASRDKYFKFTVTATNVNDDDVYTVSLADDQDANTTDGNADATSGTTAATIAANQGQTNPTSVTGAELKAGVDFYLQHGQSIAIRGLAPNAGYTVEEDREDYKDNGNILTGYTDARTGVIGTIAGDNKAVKTSFQNERTGIIPTGVLLPLIPGALAMAGAGAGLAFNRKKHSEEE